MDETSLRKKHVREPPSVPFLWEVKPGIPKKDWKPEVVSSITHFPKTPLKLIASVPFAWEEKPGTPLPNYHLYNVSVPPKPHAMLIHAASSSGNSIAFNYSSSGESRSINSSIGLESFIFDDTDESSFSSGPSLLANCLVPSAKVSSAIPLNENSFCKYNCGQLQTHLSPTSSETDSSTSSYATGISSPVGVSFLESLFPLYTPKRDVHLEKVVSSTPQELSHEDNNNNNTSDMVRRPATLEELIMMSRRRSNRRKVFHKWDPPKKMTRNQAFGCCNFVTNINMVEGLLKRKYFPRLKLA